MRRLAVSLAYASGWWALCTLSAAAAEPVDYTRQIKPLLAGHCYACHGALKQEGGLRLDTAAAAKKGGESGPAVVPGRPQKSVLIERVTAGDAEVRMPQEGQPLKEEEIALLKAWIAAGAIAPSDEQPQADPRLHWAFQKPVRPPTPVPELSSDQPAARSAVDLFLAEARHERDLATAPEAPRHVLLRRLYLDLIGLPPPRAELHAFLADERPDAYERACDRLLASPQYGERWARHWMDVWRYSDWYGRRTVPDVMNSYPHIWRWRDWIVRSLNADAGLGEMVMQMLAADELWPEDQERVVATGFIVRNWFKWNYDTWMRDQVEHTGKAFLGLTLNCALCHDHKYDPISQEDYFRFRAIFEPLELRHDRVPGLSDPGPFKKYVYAQSYGPIPHGLIRVFDEKLDAETFLYQGGDQRLKVAGRPPLPPGVPLVLGGEQYRVQPIELPAAAWYPGLRPFVQQEELARSRADLAAAEAALAKLNGDMGKAAMAASAKVAAEQAVLASVAARIEADNARFGGDESEAAALACAAAAAEREAQSAAAQHAVAAAEVELSSAEAREPADEKRAAAVQAAQKKLVAAQGALKVAQAALARESADYTPLGPVFPRQSTGRRAALARWIASRDNPLTARVAANHLWRWHFQRPLVATVANFGTSGKPPTHPALLDWLAVELMEGDWTMKRMHRQLVGSQAYRLASELPNSAALDSDNVWYGRANAGAIEAEVLRDSLLAVAGELDLCIGGQEIDHAAGLTSRRRSLYFAHHGESKMEFLELFDAASPTDCYERTSSIRPQQALALANSELAIDISKRLAALLTPAAETDEAFIAAAFEQTLSRPPTAAEAAAASRFLTQQQQLYRESAAGGDLVQRSRQSLVHVLLNHHDFVTVR